MQVGNGALPSPADHEWGRAVRNLRCLLEHIYRMGHAWNVPLRSLRHRLTVWLRIPFGYLAGFSLMVLLVVGAMPVIEVHAHADPGADHGAVADQHELAGHHGHDHDDEHDHDHEQRGTDESAVAGEAIWHAHDACSIASVLVETPQLSLGTMPPAAHPATTMVLPEVSTRPASLLRPPIV